MAVVDKAAGGWPLVKPKRRSVALTWRNRTSQESASSGVLPAEFTAALHFKSRHAAGFLIEKSKSKPTRPDLCVRSFFASS